MREGWGTRAFWVGLVSEVSRGGGVGSRIRWRGLVGWVGWAGGGHGDFDPELLVGFEGEWSFGGVGDEVFDFGGEWDLVARLVGALVSS